MLIRETRRLIFIILPLLLFTFVTYKLYNNEPLQVQVPSGVSDWIDKQFDKNYPPMFDQHKTPPPATVPENDALPALNLPAAELTLPAEPVAPVAPVAPAAPAVPAIPEQPVAVIQPQVPPAELAHQATTPTESTPDQAVAAVTPAKPSPPMVAVNVAETHDVLNSISSPDKKYFKIKMGDQKVMNPNIIPHPSLPNTWIIMAQQDGIFNTDLRFFTELYCNAQFGFDGNLACMDNPTILPVEATTSDKCSGNLAFAAFNVGPHDARMFYGPHTPFTMYGSQSSYACFGLWSHDLRELIPWGDDLVEHKLFPKGTEIQRPLPWGRIEKNFFLFWDKDEIVYAHHDLVPKRVFAKLEADGSVGPDLAPATALKDDQCLAKYLPKLQPELESIHQATNSLSITLCNRTDPTCVPSDQNTVLFTIYQHKKFHYLHALYEPYVMAFKRTAPFEVYGMSKKPFWIHGRVMPEAKTETEDPHHVAGQEMIYVVSMSWKKAGQKYHGFLDDELFLSFGIEDHDAGAIDIRAADLFMGLERCDG